MAHPAKSYSNPYLKAYDDIQLEIDRRNRERMRLAEINSVPKEEKEEGAANDNLLHGFDLFPKFRFLTEGLLGSCSFRALWGGRGTAKSWQVVDAAIWWCYHEKGLRTAFCRQIQATLEESSMELVRSRLEHWGLLGVVVHERKNKFFFDNGSQIMFIGLWKGNKPAGIKSLEGIGLTILEEAQEISEKSLEMLVPTVARTPRSEIWAIWNPRSAKDAIDALLRGPMPPARSKVVYVSYQDNLKFPPALKEQMDLAYRKNPIRAQHIWGGGYEPSAEGAIWERPVLDRAIERGKSLTRDKIKRIVIGVDPGGGGSDEIGIIAAAELFGDRACVLGDYTMSATSPNAWAKKVQWVVNYYNADCVAAEGNYGGEMVVTTLRNAGVTTRIKRVHVKQGKHIRAEPIAGLYDADRIDHFKPFPELEEQYLLTTPDGFQGTESPGRLDAATIGLSEIFRPNKPDATNATVGKRK